MLPGKCDCALGGTGLGASSRVKSSRDLEWLVENADNVIVYGLMIRKFGKDAALQIYGSTVCKVHQGADGPPYGWMGCHSTAVSLAAGAVRIVHMRCK